MSEITSRIDELLSNKKKKRVDLERNTGIPGSTIRSWITGSKPNAEALYKVSQYLNVSMEYLVTGVAEDTAEYERTENLSEEENELIQAFRNLDEHDKNAVLTLAKSLESQYSASAGRNTTAG